MHRVADIPCSIDLMKPIPEGDSSVDIPQQAPLSGSSLHSASSFPTEEDEEFLRTAALTVADLEGILGSGPSRFAPRNDRERSISEQVASLTRKEKKCLENLKQRWETRNPDLPFSDSMYLRFARTSPGGKKFNEKASWEVMKKFDHHYLSLTAEVLEPQLMTKTLFPVPGLRTKNGQDMFYMKPSRYTPKQTPTEDIIDNLAYVMQSISSSERSSTDGIGFLANMNDWKYSNFSVHYCSEFMATLQHRIPARVEIFLIVNPPSWFPAIWRIMKGMLSWNFRRKVFMIHESKLDKYLEKGFEAFLPDDMSRGTCDTEQLVKDFIAYRKFVEGTDVAWDTSLRY
mmetsp:Transcript_9104/g.16531  ORF Transcript_9104/g.16531 Transcript_9104/m.16531 type:complete len:343 (+) Transcript_9104:257-1285(+)